jgi:hypothetical protein
MFCLVALSACSTQQIMWFRGPSSVDLHSSCNRQSLGEAVADNSALTQFNEKRAAVVVKLLKDQIQKLKPRAATDAAVNTRMLALQHQVEQITSGDLHVWDEPNNVSWKLSQAMDAYIKDVEMDATSGALADKDKQTFQYVKESVSPNLMQVDYWLPDFCQAKSGEKPTNVFKGI